MFTVYSRPWASVAEAGRRFTTGTINLPALAGGDGGQEVPSTAQWRPPDRERKRRAPAAGALTTIAATASSRMRHDGVIRSGIIWPNVHQENQSWQHLHSAAFSRSPSRLVDVIGTAAVVPRGRQRPARFVAGLNIAGAVIQHDGYNVANTVTPGRDHINFVVGTNLHTQLNGSIATPLVPDIIDHGLQSFSSDHDRDAGIRSRFAAA